MKQYLDLVKYVMHSLPKGDRTGTGTKSVLDIKCVLTEVFSNGNNKKLHQLYCLRITLVSGRGYQYKISSRKRNVV
jgi:predicted RNA-binding protein with EMAP domain